MEMTITEYGMEISVELVQLTGGDVCKINLQERKSLKWPLDGKQCGTPVDDEG
jgi:hypothetical protein